jgi:AI-2 transport protein TqsA
MNIRLLPIHTKINDMKTSQIAAWLLITALLVYFLIIAKHLLIPLVVAVTIWYLINTVADYLVMIRVPRLRPPRWLAVLVAAAIILAALAGSVDIIMRTVDKMIAAAPAYERTLIKLANEVLAILGLEETPSLAALLRQVDLRPIVVNLGAALTAVASRLVLIIIYVIFLMLEQRSFPRKLQAFFPDERKYKRALSVLERINISIKTYVAVKSFISALTGMVSYAVMRLIGLDFAEFWAFLIFLLNFIPSIGSIIATALVSLFALLQFESFSPFVITLLSIGGIQLAFGNYLDPRLMGRTLNISPLVILLSLALWGSIWGVIGMALSVPIMVIIMIILAQFPSTRPVAVLLSQNGRILELEDRLAKSKKRGGVAA